MDRYVLPKNYLINLPVAIEQGDFSIVSQYLYADSELYNEQKKLIKLWKDQEIVEKFIDFVPKEVIISNNKINACVISEEKFEIESNSTERVKSFCWLYKLKYNKIKGNYQIVEITKSPL